MVGTPHLQPAPTPSAGTCARAVTRPVAAGSVFASLDLILDSQSQGGLEEAVVVVATAAVVVVAVVVVVVVVVVATAPVVVVVVVVVVDHQVNVFEGESQVASGVDTQDSQVCHSSSSEI